MEKDSAARLRRAIKENNLFLVKRLVQKVDIHNPDSGRYTSLAWAAVCGHDEIFEFLLNVGHDDDELSKDVDNNTILILLAGLKPNPNAPGQVRSQGSQLQRTALRMAQLYYERYPFTLDWSNSSGKTALHIASLKGNDEFVKVLSDLGSDIDLPDLQGNTPLHYASAWGHLSVIQFLIERGCRFAARNNDGFTAVDYAYSTITMETLQESARQQFENNKRARRNNFQAQLAARAEQSQQNERDVAAHTSDQRATSGRHRVPSEMVAPVAKESVHDSSGHSNTFAGDSGHAKDSLQRRNIGDDPDPSPSMLAPVAMKMRKQDADAIAQFMNVLRRDSAPPQVAVVDTGRPVSPLPLMYSLRSTLESEPLIHARDQYSSNDSTFEIKPLQRSTDDGHSTTSVANSTAKKGETPTPPLTKRSPFAILSRVTSHHDNLAHRGIR